MAGAFASGFQMGGGIFNQAERNRLEQAAEERRVQEFEWQKADRARQEGLRNEEDSLRQQLTRPNAENYAMAPAGGMGGLTMRAPALPPASLPASDTGLVMPQIVPSGVAGPAGEPTYRTTATMGLHATAPTTSQPTFNAAPTGASAEELLGRMALLKGDTAAFRASQEAAKGFKYADAYKNARQSWDSMSDDERGALITKASYDTNIPGHGTWVPGSGKTEGYMNFLPPGKDPVKLSASEAREIYALTQAMEIDPMKARTDLEKASDKVRSVLKDSFETLTKGVAQNNLTTYHASDLAEKGRHNKETEAIQRQQLKDGQNANKLSNVQLGMERDPTTGQLRQVMVGLQFNQKTGGFEEVRQPLTNNMIPMSAFDPKTMTPAVEAMVGKPIDPTNKNKDAPRHTEATARQAVVDQIANQYLNPANNPLSPQNAANAIKAQQEKTMTGSGTKTSAPATNTGLKVSSDYSPTNPYRTVSRGNVAVDTSSIQKDLAEYNQLASSGLQVAAGRRLFLQQKLQAAGVLDNDGNLK